MSETKSTLELRLIIDLTDDVRNFILRLLPHAQAAPALKAEATAELTKAATAVTADIKQAAGAVGVDANFTQTPVQPPTEDDVVAAQDSATRRILGCGVDELRTMKDNKLATSLKRHFKNYCMQCGCESGKWKELPQIQWANYIARLNALTYDAATSTIISR